MHSQSCALFQAVAPKGALSNLVKTVFGRWSKIEVAGIALEKSGEDDQADLTKLKDEIANAIQTVLREQGTHADRIVVFVDDLDRILPDRAVEILEALKNFVDVPGCVFVLACDYEVVKKGLKPASSTSTSPISADAPSSTRSFRFPFACRFTPTRRTSTRRRCSTRSAGRSPRTVSANTATF
ncbi:MAG: P-loop NTPase fold protein [Polyangiales bacterium]